MSEWGDVLEACYWAPRAETFAGRARLGSDWEVAVAWQRSRGVHVSRMVVGSEGQSRALAEGLTERVYDFRRDGPRWRFDHGDWREVIGPDGRFTYSPGAGATIDAGSRRSGWSGLEAYLRPRQLLGAFAFEDLGRSEAIGRPAWTLRASPTDDVGVRVRPGILDGDRAELWVDQELGIVLRAESFVGQELATRFVVEHLEVGGPLDPAVFAHVAPDGSAPRTRGERILDYLRRQGAEVEGIEPEDEAAVLAAMRQGAGVPAPDDVEAMALQHVATGPEPDDPAAAQAAIAEACARMGETSPDGQALPYVQAGGNLGPTADDARRRHGGDGRDMVAFRRAKFLTPTEAVIWLRAGPLTAYEGRAVLDDGRWKVSRATFCNLVRMIGVVCPPPP
jgi:hypothetical protein